jgi:hypothetical protein
MDTLFLSFTYALLFPLWPFHLLQKLSHRPCRVLLLKRQILYVELILLSGYHQSKALLYCMSCWNYRTRDLQLLLSFNYYLLLL